MRILYVEDNAFDVDLTRRELARYAPQHQVKVLPGLGEARSCLQSGESFDLVLLDLRLPDGNGLDLLSEIRAQSLPLAVVVLTGSGDEEAAVAALKAGADDYLVKREDYLARLPLALETALNHYRADAARMARPLRVLYAEHNAADLDLTRRHLARYAPHIHLEPASTVDEVLEHFPLHSSPPCPFDVLLLDYRLPGSNALELLKILRQDRGLDLPIILVTGQGTEEVALQAWRLGATDYLVKNSGYLYKLPILVENAFHRVQLEREQNALRESEARYRRLAENAQDLIYRYRMVPSRGFDYVNPAATAMTGYTPEEHYADPELGFKLVHPDDRPLLSQMLQGDVTNHSAVLRWVRKDGTVLWAEQHNVPVYDDQGTLIAIEGVARDITAQKHSEEQLRASEESFRLLFENNPHPMWVYDLETLRFLQVNDAAVDHYGYSRDEFLSMRITGIRSPEDAERLVEDVHRERPSLQHSGIWRHRLKNGQIIDVEITSHTLDFAGRRAVLVVAQDVTERLRAEEMLRLQSAALNAAANAIVIMDAQNTIEWVNPAFAALTGYSEQESLGRLLPELVRSDQHDPAFYKTLWDTVLSGKVWRGEVINRRKDGSLYREEQTITPVLDRDGNVTHIVSVKQDITARKQAEQALQTSEEKFRQIVETAEEGIWTIDADSKTTFINQRMAEMLGYTVDEMLGQPLLNFMDDEAKQLAATNVAGRKAGRHEFVYQRKDGTPLWTFISTNPILDEDGQYCGAQALVTDISDLKQSQQAEREQRTLAEALASTADALISALDLDAVMNTILQGVARVVPHDAANIMLIEGDEARPVYWRGYPPEYTLFVENFHISVTATPNLRLMAETGSSFLIPDIAQYADWIAAPETSWVKSYVAVPIRSHGNVIGFLNLDSGIPGFFSERHARHLQAFADQASIAIEHAQLYEEIRRHANELEERVEDRTAQLNRTLKHIEAILNNSDDIIVVCHMDGTINQVNPAFDKMFKCSSDEAVSHPLARFVVADHIPMFEQAFQKTIRDLVPQRLEMTVHCEGHTTFDADVVLSPVIDQVSEVSSVICSLRDITERKQMEVQLRSMLEHEIALSELRSRFVSMAAHDLRNPLAVIQSAVSLIHQYSDRLSPEKLQEKFAHIQSSIKVMVSLLDDILTLGKVESGKLRFESAPLDVLTFCKDIVMEMKQATGTAHTIEFSGQGDCSEAILDAKLLRHILGNLLSNAIKYSPVEQPIKLETHCTPGQIVFRVQDQGIGIPLEDQNRLFDTFHRASNVRQIPGTGLGLAIVKQSVELHGGTVSWKSQEGAGTTFVVTLPQP